jgi:S1-C subfamily serine protease
MGGEPRRRESDCQTASSRVRNRGAHRHESRSSGPIAAVLAGVLVFLGSLGPGAARAQENLPELIKKVLPTVVTVAGFNVQGKVIRIGSGFFVDSQGHLITNLHVIKRVARAEVELPIALI